MSLKKRKMIEKFKSYNSVTNRLRVEKGKLVTIYIPYEFALDARIRDAGKWGG
jgi:hypothetical protein